MKAYSYRSILLKSVILWCFFCSLILALLYILFEVEFNILFLKDFVVAIIFLAFIRRTIRVSLFLFVLLFFLFYLFISVLFSGAQVMPLLSSIRQLIVPFLFILVGYSGAGAIHSIRKYIISIGFIVLLLGFVEVYFSIWHFIDIRDYFYAKNIPVFGKNFVEFYNYPVFFIEPLFGGIKRMASTLLDPVNLGHVFAFILSILVFDRDLNFPRRKKFFFILAFIVGLLLTFSKGALLQFIILIFIVNKKISTGIKAIIIFCFTLMLSYVSKFHQGIQNHLHGLEASLRHVNLFGHGVGKVGNQASLFGEEIVVTGIGDTFFGSILGQIGIIGYILWALPFIVIMTKLKFNLMSKIFISQLLISIISENAFNFLSVFPVCIMLGMEYRKVIYNE